MRVLYVEDAELLAGAVKHNLERQGITTDLANNGEDGLDMALKDIYDCVVLDILLDNATKYGDKKIKVTLNENEVVVANDGATVEKKDLEKIFDRFYQTDKTREGSGLGLAIAKAICEQNGWKINCESEKKITKFVVRL